MVVIDGRNCADFKGTEDQKRKYLPGLNSCQLVGCWALTEPGQGSDAAGMQTTATKVSAELFTAHCGMQSTGREHSSP